MKIVDNKNTKNKVLNIQKHIKQEKINKWGKDNQKAIDFYNERIKTNGLFSDGLRLF
ncbi:type II toxin-antitoxin system CcdA family antitoxin [Aliarcobacter butzleri]|uniref:type II toxin-antitoxin system CcdA family antitoxin n=1 Tax=Aliarcobacter butzleri TaxID=28197 RepID=UPI0019199301|nr:type II toxin-antitoxin system CcdA family antitoxin [Aliarcobacter butzleri]MCG3711321.1 type II toxin-antitoxin system CcdA family antitoxin [Aliarcobacter butzleri]MCG3715137.1 type II toxin-antitoxin system CcdA family antitoxin [Aliarcobacter butzleri]